MTAEQFTQLIQALRDIKKAVENVRINITETKERYISPVQRAREMDELADYRKRREEMERSRRLTPRC